MNNLRLLAGLVVIALPSIGARASGPETISLEEIFAVAEAHSAQLRTAFAQQLVAERETSVARTERLPEITTDIMVAYNGDGFTTDRHFKDYQKAPIPHFGNGLSIGLEQPVYTGGAIPARIRLSELKSTASKFATELKRDNIRLRIASCYLDIYKFMNLREVVESNLLSARHMLSDMEARYEQGTALANDITRYQLLVSNLELEHTKISNTLQILNSDLVTTSGLPEGTVVIPDSTILSRALENHDRSWWRNQAHSSSPAIAIARTSVDIGQKGEELARAQRLPSVGIRAEWTFEGPILTEVPPINRNLSYWYVGLGVKYKISALYKARKSVALAKAATFQAQSELDSVTEDIDMAVATNHVRYLESLEELKTRTKGLELALQNYSVVATRYNNGIALITDMLDAAASRLDAEQQLVNARINIIYNYYNLLFTSGII